MIKSFIYIIEYLNKMVFKRFEIYMYVNLFTTSDLSFNLLFIILKSHFALNFYK